MERVIGIALVSKQLPKLVTFTGNYNFKPIMTYPFLYDLGVMAIFLITSFFIRYLIKPLQALFIPISVIAGILALLLSQNVFDLVNFSYNAGAYPGIFICFIFAAIPFTFIHSHDVYPAQRRGAIMRMMLFIAAILFLQWGMGMLFNLTILKNIFPDLHNGFGGLIATGSFGGHGTAAAISESFSNSLDWEAVESLAMTSATVGIFASTIGGIILIQWGIKRKHTRYLQTIHNLPSEFKTGVIPQIRQSSMGRNTFSSVAVDPLLMHFLVIFLIGFLAYVLSKESAKLFNGYGIAGFSIAFFLGLIVKWILRKTRAIQYFDHAIMIRVCGLFTDLLVAFGIASIKIAIIIEYALPLSILFVAGLLLCYYCFRILGRAAFERLWFENSIFTWGWITGITAMGITLLRMVDPENKSPVLQNFAIAYLAISPFEVLFLLLFPFVISQEVHWFFTVGCVAIGGGLWHLLMYRKKVI